MRWEHRKGAGLPVSCRQFAECFLFESMGGVGLGLGRALKGTRLCQSNSARLS